MNSKQIAAENAIELVADGMVVGLGSGSTARYAIERLGEKVKDGLSIKAVATSIASETLARDLSITVIDPSDAASIDIDIAIDGADEVDRKGNLMKGGGGSLLREKVIAFASKRFYVIVDESKQVDKLGKRPLPVEIIPFGSALTLSHIERLGCKPVLRTVDGKAFITDNNNLIVDCQFEKIKDPAWLDIKFKMIPGVVETGLFLQQIVTGIFIGHDTGEVRVISLNP